MCVEADAENALANGRTATTGDLLKSIGSGTNPGLGSEVNVLPTAFDALFSAGFGSAFSVDLGISVLSNTGFDLVDGADSTLLNNFNLLPDAVNALPSAIEALFGGSTASSANDVT